MKSQKNQNKIAEILYLTSMEGVMMDSKDYLSKQIKSMWYLQDSVLKGLNNEDLTQKPPGTLSSIGIIWLHMANGEDNFISTITGDSPLWKTCGWNEKFKLEGAPNIGEDWTEYQDAALNIHLLQDYTAAIRKQTLVCLNATSAETLDETVKFFKDSDPKANVWVLLVGHTLIHSGEIAAIKGILGGRGLPF